MPRFISDMGWKNGERIVGDRQFHLARARSPVSGKPVWEATESKNGDVVWTAERRFDRLAEAKAAVHDRLAGKDPFGWRTIVANKIAGLWRAGMGFHFELPGVPAYLARQHCYNEAYRRRFKVTVSIDGSHMTVERTG